MAAINRCDIAYAQTLGYCNEGSINRAKWKIAILHHPLCDAHPDRRRDRFGDQIASSEITEETHLGVEPSLVPSR